MKKILLMLFVFSFVFAVTQIPVEASSLTDIMGEMGNQEVPEDNFLSDASSGITKFAGILISVIIYIFFALVALTTAIDLLYIVFPPIRSSLYPRDEQSSANYQGYSVQAQYQNQVQQKRKKCWITNDLKKLLITCSLNNKKVLIVNYFKARMINIIFAVFVMILLVTTSVFTDTGMNIGKAILNFLGF